jgi:hypothetical protein
MEQLQFVINNFTADKRGNAKELQVVIDFPGSLTIQPNTLGNCFKLLVDDWYRMPLGDHDNIVFYRFNEEFEIVQCINGHLQDDIVKKSIPKIKKMFFEGSQALPLSELPNLDQLTLGK